MKKKWVVIKIVLAVFVIASVVGRHFYQRSKIYAKGSEFFAEIYKTDGTTIWATNFDDERNFSFVLGNNTQILNGGERLSSDELNVGDKIEITCNKVVDFDDHFFISDIETIKLVDTTEQGE